MTNQTEQYTLLGTEKKVAANSLYNNSSTEVMPVLDSLNVNNQMVNDTTSNQTITGSINNQAVNNNIIDPDRYYIGVLGNSGVGKTYIIASLIQAMHESGYECYLDKDYSSPTERELYKRMRDIYENRPEYINNERLGGTAVGDFQQLNMVFNNRRITFIDLAGEDFRVAMQNEDKNVESISQILNEYALRKEINMMFLLVYDASIVMQRRVITDADPNDNQQKQRVQNSILNALYSQLLNIQARRGGKFKKLLMISKWDEYVAQVPQVVGEEQKREQVWDFIHRFLPNIYNSMTSQNEKQCTHLVPFSVGRFRNDVLVEATSDYAKKALSIIYQNMAGEELYKRSIWEKIMAWLSKLSKKFGF